MKRVSTMKTQPLLWCGRGRSLPGPGSWLALGACVSLCLCCPGLALEIKAELAPTMLKLPGAEQELRAPAAPARTEKRPQREAQTQAGYSSPTHCLEGGKQHGERSQPARVWRRGILDTVGKFGAWGTVWRQLTIDLQCHPPILLSGF